MHFTISKFKIFFMFVIFLQISITKENKLAIRNEALELKFLEEITFGSAILRFDSTGLKFLVNVNDASKEKLAFSLKNGENSTKIPDNDLIEFSISVKLFDSSKQFNNNFILIK